MIFLALTFAMTATLSVIALHMTETENLTRKVRQMKRVKSERFASL
ncbi:MAG: hypothetical protein AAGA76_07610 [Pseudomonadota bacterium]